MRRLLGSRVARYGAIILILFLSFVDTYLCIGTIAKRYIVEEAKNSRSYQVDENSVVDYGDYICLNQVDGLFYVNVDGKYYRLDAIRVETLDIEIPEADANRQGEFDSEDKSAEVSAEGTAKDVETKTVESDKSGESALTEDKSFAGWEAYEVNYSVDISDYPASNYGLIYSEALGAYVGDSDTSMILDTRKLTIGESKVVCLGDYSNQAFFVKYPKGNEETATKVFMLEEWKPEEALDAKEWAKEQAAIRRESQLGNVGKFLGTSEMIYGGDPEVPFFVVTIMLGVLIAFVLGSVGHVPEDDLIHLTYWDRIGWSIHGAVTVGLLGLGILPITLGLEFGSWGTLIEAWYLGGITVVVWVLATGWFVETTVVRLKAGCFWRTTTIGYIFMFIKTPIEQVYRTHLEHYKAKQDGRLGIDGLAKETQAVIDGRKEKVDVWGLDAHYLSFAENINALAEGKTKAVDEMLKSERMRTELITNVSHDIKTPLTSIISYADLLAKKDFSDEETREYLEIIEGQSKRLKVLLEDLIEASKAANGVLPVRKEELEAKILLTQIMSEFADKFEARKLTVISDFGDDEVMINSDPKHLSRVLSNLFSNIAKYAMEGSRVYVQLVRGERTEIVLKNTSASQLNVTAEELKERFARGDSARSEEGSGLGLAIAESLMELMGGKLELEIDGDLFKARVII